MDERINFLCNVANGISELLSNKEKEKKQVFVKEIFEETEKVYNNFRQILQKAYYEIETGKMTVDDAVMFFNNERLPFKSSRAKIRGRMKHPYYQKNKELEWFNVGIRGVLCGGLHYCTEMLLRNDIRENDIFLDIEITFKGYHTVVDLIKLYDRENMNSLFYSERYLQYSDKREVEKAIKERLLLDIHEQIQKIDESWQMVCDYYPQIMF